jgi:hypothetical protein
MALSFLTDVLGRPLNLLQALPGIFGQAILPPATVGLPAVEAPGSPEAVLVPFGSLNGANEVPFAKLCRSGDPHHPTAFSYLGHIHCDSPSLGIIERMMMQRSITLEKSSVSVPIVNLGGYP